MKRYVHLTLALGAVSLLALLLMLAAGEQPAAHADGDIIKVPDDYATIQAAIDAATGGIMHMILITAAATSAGAHPHADRSPLIARAGNKHVISDRREAFNR